MKKKTGSSIEVAKLANVSQSTVSRVFTRGSNVSETTRAKVLKAAETLNYHPNAFARGLIMKKTNIIGLAMKDIQNPFYHEVLGVFSKKLRDAGYIVLFVYTENDEIQRDEIQHFLEYNVEAIIVTDALLSSKLVEQLNANDIPVILFNRYDKSLQCNSVSSDNLYAASEIATFAVEQGHKDIVFISGKENTSTSRDRQKGFTKVLDEKGIHTNVLLGDYTYEKAYYLTKEMLDSGHVPDLIFGANDITALGALDALKQANIRVPKETSVIGFDNIRMADWPKNELSTWEQPVEEMVNEVMLMLQSNEIKKDHYAITCKGKFIPRKTTTV